MQDFIISRFNSFSLNTKGLTPENLMGRSRKDFTYIPKSDTLVICLPGWGQSLRSWWGVKAHVTNSYASFLSYQFPREILSDQFKLTRECFEAINRTIREDVKDLKEQYGFKRCVLAGLSLSSSFASMIYKNNPDINEVVLVVPGENLARDMWYGCRTQHLKCSYKRQGITLEELEQEWHDLAPENNLPAPNTKISLYLAKQDKVIPYKLSKNLPKVLEARGYMPRVRPYYFLGHYAASLLFLYFPSFFIKLK